MRLILTTLALLLMALPVDAQQRTPAAPHTTTHGLPCDLANLLPGCRQSDGSIFGGLGAGSTATTAGNPLLSILKEFADFIDGDNIGAINLSQSIKELPDGNGYACWSQMRGFSQVVKLHPVPLTLKLQTDIEALRLLMMAANKVCGNSACQQINSEFKNGIMAAAPINPGISPPFDLNNICSKIPQISQQALPADAKMIEVPAPANAPAAAPPQ